MGLAETVTAWYSNEEVFNGTISGLIIAILVGMRIDAVRMTRFFLRRAKLGFVARLVGVMLGWLLVSYFLSSIFTREWIFAGLGVVLTGCVILMTRSLTLLGIVDAHTRTRSGIDFKTSLKMARSSIDFLGIGADKLTKLDEFEQAMRRCGTSGNRVRLLLSPPDNPILERHAKRNGVDAFEYKERVLESLRRIARLRAKHALEIEVRFYRAINNKDLQQFRLMFIDRSICLAGWTVWGSHVGNDNPQLVLRERPRVNPDVTAYKAFHDYFEALWDDADTVDVDLRNYN